MRFATYLEANINEKWRSQYIRYKELKELLYEVLETGAPVVVPQGLSLTVKDTSWMQRRQVATPHERFFIDLEAQVAMINSFTLAQAQLLREQLRVIESRLQKLTTLGYLSSQLSTAGSQGSPSPHRTSVSGITIALQGAGSAVSAGGSIGTSEGHPVSSLTAELLQQQSQPQPAVAPAGRRVSSSSDEEDAANNQQQVQPSAPAQSTAQAAAAGSNQRYTWAQLQQDAQAVGREYLALEKYVNLNYAALQKILKKHDKLIPSAPCWAFFRLHTSHQPWVRGEHHDIQVTLARVFSKLHTAARMATGRPIPALPSTDWPARLLSLAVGGSVTAGPSGAPGGAGGGDRAMPYNTVEVARKFWVRIEDMAELEYHILQHLPVCGLHSQFSEGDLLDPHRHPRPHPHAQSQTLHHHTAGRRSVSGEDTSAGRRSHQMGETVNLLYLDNASLELYHNLLYGRPYAALIRLRWTGDKLHPRENVVLQRKVYREGWRPDTSVKDSFPLEEKRVAEFLAGRWTFADARKQLLQPNRPEHHHHHPTHRHQQHTTHSYTPPQPTPAGSGPSAAGPSTAIRSPFSNYTSATAAAFSATGGASSFMTYGALGSSMVREHIARWGPGMAAGVITAGTQDPSATFNSLAHLAEEMEATQREYALFKTFTEVQRAVETKALQPVVRIRMHQTTFEDTSVTPAEALARAQEQEGPDAACVTRVQVDSQIRAYLEYSTDGMTRIANNLWRQAQPADAVDFPYGCVTVVMVCPEEPPGDPEAEGGDGWWHPTSLPRWLQCLVDSGKLLEIQDFSKFLFGCAGLLPDMVRAVPVWIDDPLLQRCLEAQVLYTPPAGPAPGTSKPGSAGQPGATAPVEVSFSRQSSHRHHRDSLDASGMGGSASASASNRNGGKLKSLAQRESGAGSVAISPGAPAHQRQRSFNASGTSPAGSRQTSIQARGPSRRGSPGPGETSGVSAQEEEAGGTSPGVGGVGEAAWGAGDSGGLPRLLRQASHKLTHEIKGWQVKLLARQHSRGRVYQPQALFIEPGQFLRSERIFLTWLTMTITLSGLACGMLGFAATATRDPRAVSILHVCEATAFTLLGLAIVMCIYALITFLWRSDSLYELRPHRVDDTRGTLALNLVCVLALSSLWLLNLYDFTEQIAGKGKHKGGGRNLLFSGGSSTGSVSSRVAGSAVGSVGGRDCSGCRPYWGDEGCSWGDAEGSEVVRLVEAGVCGIVRLVTLAREGLSAAQT